MSTDNTTGPDQSDSSVSARENLSLDSIDLHRRTTISFDLVFAACFAARTGHSVSTVHRFVTALALTGNLTSPGMWPHVLQTVMDLEDHARQERNPAP